jgi:DNA mismatch repair protein MutS
LTDLSESLEGVHNLSVAVREWEDEIIFLHRIVEGGTDRSYGIQVARLAGVPAALIERAKVVLGELEGTLGHAAGKNSPEARLMVSGEMQLGLFGPEPSALDEAVKDLDPENMTPMEALAKVRELKDLT